MNENETLLENTEAPAAEEPVTESPEENTETEALTENTEAETPAEEPEKKSPKVKKTSPKKNTAALSRKRKHGLISLVTTLFVVAAVVLVNVIAVTLNNKTAGMTADLTRLRSFELTSKTKKLLDGLDKSVTLSFMSDRSSYISLDSYCKQTVFIAEEMAKYSKGALTVEYADIVRNPAYAEGYDENELNTTDIVISCGDNKQILTVSDIFKFERYSDNYSYIVSSDAEEKFDNAILAVSTDKIIKTVIFSDNSDADPSYLEKVLTYNGYDVSYVSVADDEIPSDADMAVIYAPAKDYSEAEVNKIKSFLENGGEYRKTLLFAASPLELETPNLDALLEEYGMYLGNGYAFDSGENVLWNDSLTGVYAQQNKDGIFNNVVKEDENPVLTPVRTRPIGFEGDNAMSLLCYSENSGMQPFGADESWSAENSIVGNVCVFGMGVNGTEEKSSTIITAGSYMMFDKSYMNTAFSNKKYFSVIFDSVNGREIKTVDIPEKILSSYDMDIDSRTAVNAGFIVYAIIPLIILGAGFTVYLLRRNR